MVPNPSNCPPSSTYDKCKGGRHKPSIGEGFRSSVQLSTLSRQVRKN